MRANLSAQDFALGRMRCVSPSSQRFSLASSKQPRNRRGGRRFNDSSRDRLINPGFAARAGQFRP
jgi:hypothetical protein